MNLPVRPLQFFIIFCTFIFSTEILAQNEADDESFLQKEGFGPGPQYWEHVEVRPGAFMFYWLFYTTADVPIFTARPLLIWLQSGPDVSSSGMANLNGIGPIDVELSPRESSFVNDFNVLFIDCPVGSGFSYVTSDEQLATNNEEVARDMVQMMRAFYDRLPIFKKVPLFIFSENYGGKIVAELALQLNEAITKNTIDCDFRSVGLGAPWISPLDSIWSWAPYLLNLGFVDDAGYEDIIMATQDVQDAFDKGNFVAATELWSATENLISQHTFGIDFNNVLQPKTFVSPGENKAKNLTILDTLKRFNKDVSSGERFTKINDIMRGPVSEALEIPNNIVWGSQSANAFQALVNDIIRPVTNVVEQLLNSTNVLVSVFSGQLDLSVTTISTVNWVNNMETIFSEEYAESTRQPLLVDNILEGYYKGAGTFKLYWINRAGSMIATDNIAAVRYVILAEAGNLSVLERDGFGPGKQYWEHVEVRPDAFMFFWLYYTTAEVENFTDRPLVIWLQGGPGTASSGYGNILALGPLDLDLNTRTTN